MPLAESRGGASGGVWGNAPTVPRATNSKDEVNKGAGSEASLPVTLRFLRSAPQAALYYFQIHLRHLLAPFPRLRPLIPLSVALLRCVSFALASAKNSLRILAHSHLEIVLPTTCILSRRWARPTSIERSFFLLLVFFVAGGRAYGCDKGAMETDEVCGRPLDTFAVRSHVY